MKLLLDTHIFIWADDEPERIPAALMTYLADEANELWLSLVSAWEMQIKRQLGKLHLQLSLAETTASHQQTNGLRLLPITAEHVYALDNLPLHHKDPFDRLLIAQAIAEDLTLVSVDPAFAAYSIKLLS
jgi:PIN domain nuclease of toxin-antitoxin system